MRSGRLPAAAGRSAARPQLRLTFTAQLCVAKRAGEATSSVSAREIRRVAVPCVSIQEPEGFSLRSRSKLKRQKSCDDVSASVDYRRRD